GGIRVRYNDINEEFLYSPRAQFSFKPLNIKKDISFKLAGGIYYQPPFYKERRIADGNLNFELKSQKSIQIVAGMSYDFTWVNFSNSKMRFISEFYYKSLSDLISYEQDNVHLVYSGYNDAEGYVAGMDFRLNGEFVKGAESWINLSFLRTRESLLGIQHKIWEENEGKDVEDVPRATDQLVALSMFFQDYLPKNEHFKVHVNLNLGTGLPYGQKGNNEIYRNAFRYPPYHRIDLGFSYLLWNIEMKKNKPLHPLRFTQNTWVSLEVYNLMAVSNVASVSWIKTYNNYNFAIKNRLTSRRINLKFKIDF
ncbi:MAG TPA: TonB-dependent receptor, partial [Saprospiraceae bacterium]|nr:TonB-dependent receptor [Saprospiraceae bacterium]